MKRTYTMSGDFSTARKVTNALQKVAADMPDAQVRARVTFGGRIKELILTVEEPPDDRLY